MDGWRDGEMDEWMKAKWQGGREAGREESRQALNARLQNPNFFSESVGAIRFLSRGHDRGYIIGGTLSWWHWAVPGTMSQAGDAHGH